MKEVLDKLNERFGDAIKEQGCFRGDEYAVIAREKLLDVCRFLKQEKKYKFDMLVDLCAVDYLGKKERFEVVYHLYSVEHGRRLRLKVRVKEDDALVPSVCSIWKAANWFEREAFDLFGVHFEGHPNLKRILTFEGFEGHALRKDYPINKRQPIPESDPLI
jgi:NADH-quinone oxidoreductase subunit C